MNAVEARGLTRRFGGRTALDGLDLAVERGELFGLVGPDGAGKTTTLRLLTGLLRPHGGTARVAGLDVARATEAVRERIGYMSQRFGLYEELSVAENVAFYADIYGVPRAERRRREERLLSFSGLGPFRRRLAGRLSGGMKQKLGLVCALIHTPEILFLDEPTNGVDPVSRRELWRILHRLLLEGVTLFVSTAYLDEAERCHRVGLLHEGSLRACAPPDEVKKLLPGELAAVETADPRAAARALRAALPGASVALFGRRVHVAGPTVEETRARAAEVLGEGRAEVRAVEPTLEDVFVSVLGREEAER